MRRPLVIITILALLAGGVGLVAAQPSHSPAAKAPERPAVTIRGHVSGLYPGAVKRIRLRLHNNSPRVRVVTRIRARVKSTAGGCPAGNLRVRPKKVRRRLPAHGRAKVRYPIRMVADATGACQGKRFRLHYRARVRQPSGGER